MENDGQEKQHAATGKRIAELRRKGSVMRSKDLASGLVILVAVIAVSNMTTQFKNRLEENFTISFNAISHILTYQDDLTLILAKMVYSNFVFLLPVLLLLLVTILLSPFVFGGWNFSLEALQFNIGKINPITNLKSIFSPKRMAGEMFKSMLKATVIMAMLFYFVYNKKEEIFILINHSPKTAIIASYSILKGFVITLIEALIFLVAFDVMYHYFQFQNQIKMSTQELKDEHKDAEGSVEVKQKMRAKRFALLRQRLSQTVPQAHVILVNPLHYAVALRYDQKKDQAPKVVAKGKDAVAQQIRTIAISNGIPIYQAPALARAVYHTTKINHEIDSGLYMAVAIVLSYVHQLKNYQMGVGQVPNYVSEFDLPEKFIYEE
jgi:flagellar biosynthetic protein FlhB